MHRFARNFIIASIIYLGPASILGIWMLWKPSLISLKFVHSQLLFYSLNIYIPGAGFDSLSVIAGMVEVFSLYLFFYNMLATLLSESSS